MRFLTCLVGSRTIMSRTSSCWSTTAHGDDDLLHLVVEIKGYRGEDAKEKKSTMETYWVPGVNHLASYGRWAFAEFTDVYAMQDDFEVEVEAHFDEMIKNATADAALVSAIAAS